MQTVEELEQQLAEARANSTQTNVPTIPTADPYAVTAWGQVEYDFQVPSGQLCRMRKLLPEELVKEGILDQLTRLPGLAQVEIDKAEGARPASLDQMPSGSDITALLDVLNKLIPLVVVQPKVYADSEGESREPGRVYVSDIELADRIAIMERATGGVQKFDAFREQS